jgi:hypothetical protein
MFGVTAEFDTFILTIKIDLAFPHDMWFRFSVQCDAAQTLLYICSTKPVCHETFGQRSFCESDHSCFFADYWTRLYRSLVIAT